MRLSLQEREPDGLSLIEGETDPVALVRREASSDMLPLALNEGVAEHVELGVIMGESKMLVPTTALEAGVWDPVELALREGELEGLTLSLDEGVAEHVGLVVEERELDALRLGTADPVRLGL